MRHRDAEIFRMQLVFAHHAMAQFTHQGAGAATMVVGVLNVIEGVANPVQTGVYALAGALVAVIAFRGAWRAITRSPAVPSVLETPPYEVKAADNVVPFAPALSENCARVLR